MDEQHNDNDNADISSDENTGNENTNGENTGDGNTGDEIIDAKPTLELEGVEPIRYSSLGVDYQYTIVGGDRVSKFLNEPILALEQI